VIVKARSKGPKTPDNINLSILPADINKNHEIQQRLQVGRISVRNPDVFQYSYVLVG
jgi:hypothetical protein